ncbi:MAG: CBS domain-containing protein [Methanomicrobiales archaeon]|nr:CBS domain-containing protein [Methanomicrobiales archaeon]MDD1654584.1 CBS domain-containing protein [Methanomicrobiales archaeon]
MDLSLIQKEILITLITLYHQHSHAIKGEEIADVLKRNPGTVRNQMQALKAIGLVDGVPGPKGGYNPTALAYRELNLSNLDQEASVPVMRKGEPVPGIRVTEVDFVTLCHPDLCHAVIKLVGSVKAFEIGEEITVGPTPVNKLILRGEVIGKDEVQQSLVLSITEMLSLPKQPVRNYMSSPLLVLGIRSTFGDALRLFTEHHIHGAPIVEDGTLRGIVSLTDIAKGLTHGRDLDAPVASVMTTDVVYADASTRLYEVVRQFKERQIGRLIVVEAGVPVGILTQSDVIGLFPSL